MKACEINNPDTPTSVEGFQELMRFTLLQRVFARLPDSKLWAINVGKCFRKNITLLDTLKLLAQANCRQSKDGLLLGVDTTATSAESAQGHQNNYILSSSKFMVVENKHIWHSQLPRTSH
jgi:hypothetical protein